MQFENLLEDVKQFYNSFWDFKGRGGVFGNLTIVIIIGLIIKVWKKSTEEKLIKYGYKNEVDSLRNLYLEGISTQYEFEEKLKKLLDEHNIKSQYENQEKLDFEQKERINNLLNQIESLKNKGLIDELEFIIKKAEINSVEVEIPSKRILDKYASKFNFDNTKIDKYFNEEFNPIIEDRSNKELLEILIHSDKYNKNAVFQTLVELNRRNTTANTV